MNKNFYKEINGRLFYVQQEEGKVEITTGSLVNHVHSELNLRQAKKLHKWLDKYIVRKRKK